jgi:hypothetical protein
MARKKSKSALMGGARGMVRSEAQRASKRKVI